MPSAVHRRNPSWQVFHGHTVPAGHATAHPYATSEAIRELVLDDQRLRNDICWSVFDC